MLCGLCGWRRAAADLTLAVMTADERMTAFVTGAAGFLGTELVRVLRRRGHRVFGLTRSIEGAERLRRSGAVPVMGDLLESGQWHDEAAADWVFHLTPHCTTRGSATAAARVSMDGRLLDTLGMAATRRIVYVADASYYGATGSRPITEDRPPLPFARGRRLMPALTRLDGYIVTGLPVVTAFPGVIYGNGSWLREGVIDPVMADRRVLRLGSAVAWVSPIHVHDCARALVHLAEHGEAGARYFLANSQPIRMRDFALTVARLLRRRLRLWRLPAPVTRRLADSALTDYLRGHSLFSNIRLRGTGFRFAYPTVDDGLREILEVPHE